MNVNCTHLSQMPKSEAISVRVSAETKAAAEKAAEADRRSVASLVEKILAEWLKANGYLKTAAKSPHPEKEEFTDPDEADRHFRDLSKGR